MKKQLMLYAVVNLTAIFALGQEENPSPPTEDSPLIQLVNSPSDLIDFNNLENFRESKDTEEEDLYRKTYPEEIILASQQQEVVKSELPAEILTVDNIDFNLSGTNRLTPLGTKTIVVGEDTVFYCDLLKIQETYTIKKWLDTVTQYDNTYYSFVKDGIVVLEVFNKQRLWMGNLGQTFEGTSINTVGTVPAIQLVLTPNPATTNCAAQFVLYESGFTHLRLVNQSTTVDKELFSGTLESGSQSLPFDTSELAPGIYTVFLQFDNATYSTNLVIQ